MKKKYLIGMRVGVTQNPDKVGIIELRRGVSDISIGDRDYAQVRIRIHDERTYISGMAFYSDCIPDMFDVMCYVGEDPSSWSKDETAIEPEAVNNKEALTIIDSQIKKIELDWFSELDPWENKSHQAKVLMQMINVYCSREVKEELLEMLSQNLHIL